MIYRCRVAGRTLKVEVDPDGGLTVDGKPVQAELRADVLVVDGRPRPVTLSRDGDRCEVIVGHRRLEVEVLDDLAFRLAASRKSGAAASGGEIVKAPMPGVVTRVAVAPGQKVVPGDLLLVLEAMKMANEVCARRAGTVRAVSAAPGRTVAAGEDLLTLG